MYCELPSIRQVGIMGQAHSKILNNFLALASTQVAGRIIRFLYMLAFARLLEPWEVGIYLYGIALYLGVIGVSLFGQNLFLAQRISKHESIPYPVLHHSLTLTLAATLVVAGGLTMFVWVSESEPILRLTILFFVGAMVARVIALWVRSAYVAFERPTWVPKYEVIFRGSEAIAGVAMLLLGGGLLGICFLHFLLWAIEAGFALRKLAREHPGALGLGRRWDYLKRVAAVSVVFLTSITAISLFPQIAIILLRKLQPDGAFVGHFGIAMQFLTILMIVPMAVTQAFLPRLSRSFSRGDGGRDLITAAKLVGLLALAGAITAAAYGPWFITLVLGPKYGEAADLFRWLCWVFTPYAVTVILGQCFNVIGGRGEAVIITAGMTIIHAALLVAYIEQSPAVAAIGSMVVAALCGMIVALYQVNRKLGFQGHLWWVKSILVIAVTYAVSESSWAPLMITTPVALVVGAALTWLLQVFDDDDIAAIRRVLGYASVDAPPK